MSDVLEERIGQALRLIVEAETLRELGTREAWEVMTQYERAARLLRLAADACETRGRACWSRRIECPGEGGIRELWIGEGGEIIDS